MYVYIYVCFTQYEYMKQITTTTGAESTLTIANSTLLAGRNARHDAHERSSSPNESRPERPWRSSQETPRPPVLRVVASPKRSFFRSFVSSIVERCRQTSIYFQPRELLWIVKK